METLDNIIGENTTEIKKTVLNVIDEKKDDLMKTAASKLGLSSEKLQMLGNVLDMLDGPGDGKVKKADVGMVIRSLGKNPTDSEVEKMASMLNVDDNDTIDISNLLEVVDDQGLMKISDEETLREAFKVFDSDNSGYLSKEEFSNIMTNKGEMKLTLTEVEEMLAKVDADKDGKLKYDEFVKLFVEN